MHHKTAILSPLFVLLATFASLVQAKDTVIVHSAEATQLEKLAAREVRRYVYLRTGSLLPIRTATEGRTDADRIVVGTKNRALIADTLSEQPPREKWKQLKPEQYLLRTVQRDGQQVVIVAGGDAIGVLYGAYRLAEQLGIRFYLHGDVVPDARIALDLPILDELGTPLFRQRGIQPFHDFPEGPDWWDTDDYKAILAQLPKLRMNFIGLHTYPEGPVGPEPTVWIGPSDELGSQGKVTVSYPSRHFVTRNVTSAWGYQPQKTSSYAFGAAALFSRDNYGASYMEGTYPWPEMNQAESNGLFDRFGSLLHESFSFAHTLGIHTCVGTETPLVLPKLVRQRLEAAGKSPTDPQTVQQVYEGMFRRIMAAYPIDYYWLWTPENWTWQAVKQEQIEATLSDFKAAEQARAEVDAPFQLATCGWVLGPPQNPALFDSVLPKSWPLSCINRNVGHDPVEPGFEHVTGRPQWAIPWLEDDPALIIPQLWVGRMRKDAADALRYGCDGLLGIHWRTRVLGPNVAALAQASWSQLGWKTAAINAKPPQLEGSFEERRVNYPPWRKADATDFYVDWAQAEFGDRAGERIGPVFAQLDCALPRPADWVDGPGGLVPDRRPWRTVLKEYDFVDQLRDLRPLVQGAGNLERFDYWLNNFRYLRAIGKLNCTWSELKAVLENMKQVKDEGEGKQLAERKAIPLRMRLIRELTYVQEYLLQTVSTKGGMGTVANWQQHVFPLLLDDSEKAIVEATHEPLPDLARLPSNYSGPARMFVPVVRTLLNAGESLNVQSIVLGERPAIVIFFWRALGAERFKSQPMRHLERGIYQMTLEAQQIEGDFEYYVEATLDGKQLRFPATAPDLNQTVVLMANTE